MENKTLNCDRTVFCVFFLILTLCKIVLFDIIFISRIGLLDKLKRVSSPILLALLIDSRDQGFLEMIQLLLSCHRAFIANKIHKSKSWYSSVVIGVRRC